MTKNKEYTFSSSKSKDFLAILILLEFELPSHNFSVDKIKYDYLLIFKSQLVNPLFMVNLIELVSAHSETI